MRQKFKNSTSLSPENSSSRTGDNLSPSILGSIENEVNWTPSSQQSSPPRTQKERKNDLSLIQEDDQHDVVQDFSVKAQGKLQLIFFGVREHGGREFFAQSESF